MYYLQYILCGMISTKFQWVHRIDTHSSLSTHEASCMAVSFALSSYRFNPTDRFDLNERLSANEAHSFWSTLQVAPVYREKFFLVAGGADMSTMRNGSTATYALSIHKVCPPWLSLLLQWLCGKPCTFLHSRCLCVCSSIWCSIFQGKTELAQSVPTEPHTLQGVAATLDRIRDQRRWSCLGFLMLVFSF